MTVQKTGSPRRIIEQPQIYCADENSRKQTQLPLAAYWVSYSFRCSMSYLLELLLTDGVLETDGARDFYPTDNRKSFTVMIAGNKIISQVIQSQAIAIALCPNSC